MPKTNAISLVVIGIGLAAQRSIDAPLVVTGEQLNKLAIVGIYPIEPGATPFRNCTARKLTGVVR